MNTKRLHLLLKKGAMSSSDCLISGSVREGMEFIHEFHPRTDCHTITIYPPRSAFRVAIKLEIADETYQKHSQEEVDQFLAQEVMRLAEFMKRATDAK